MIVINPKGQLEKLLKEGQDEDFLAAFAYAEACFQDYGLKLLLKSLQFKGIQSRENAEERLGESLRRWHIVEILYNLNLIEDGDKSIITEVAKKRNKIIHSISEVYKIDKIDSEKLLRKAIKIISDFIDRIRELDKSMKT